MPDVHSIEISNAKALLPLIRGSVIAVYLAGREKPMTGLVVCGFAGPILIARSNSSTHLIPVDGIRCIRFAPDSEPGRSPGHKLFAIVRQKHGHPVRGGNDAPARISGRSAQSDLQASSGAPEHESAVAGPPVQYPVRDLPAFKPKLNRQQEETRP